MKVEDKIMFRIGRAFWYREIDFCKLMIFLSKVFISNSNIVSSNMQGFVMISNLEHVPINTFTTELDNDFGL